MYNMRGIRICRNYKSCDTFVENVQNAITFHNHTLLIVSIFFLMLKKMQTIFLLLLLPSLNECFLSRHRQLPLHLVKYLKSNIETKSDYSCEWEETSRRMKRRIIDKYFGENINEYDKCELFCVQGIPAACMIYNRTNSYDQPIANSFYLNKFDEAYQQQLNFFLKLI